ncbi:MAG TPA: fasciclin domain-containing protein [Microbacterium sp.]|nr:fasciclin domain-containing protein [Microbacterium sp.]
MRRAVLALVASIAVSAIAASPAAAKSRWGAPPAGSAVDVAVKASGGGTPDGNPYDYDLLVQAVTATGLAPVLDNESQRFTGFAPNDRAFMRLVADLTGKAPASEQAALNTAVSALGLPAIKNVLLYHVVAGRKLGPLQVLLSRSLTMANGGTIEPRGVTLRDESPAPRDPRLVLFSLNIQATNGVIHTIDRVLVPAAG